MPKKCQQTQSELTSQVATLKAHRSILARQIDQFRTDAKEHQQIYGEGELTSQRTVMAATIKTMKAEGTMLAARVADLQDERTVTVAQDPVHSQPPLPENISPSPGAKPPSRPEGSPSPGGTRSVTSNGSGPSDGSKPSNRSTLSRQQRGLCFKRQREEPRIV